MALSATCASAPSGGLAAAYHGRSSEAVWCVRLRSLLQSSPLADGTASSSIGLLVERVAGDSWGICSASQTNESDQSREAHPL